MILASAVLFTLAAAAAGLVDAGRANVSVCVHNSERLIWEFQSSCSGKGSRGGKSALMSYNALGLRDRDYPQEHSAFRILLVGSSALVAPGLAEEFGPVRVLEKRLRRTGKVEVINAATEGYFTTQNAIRLPEYLRAYKPDLVLFDFSARTGVFSDASLKYSLRYESGYPAGIEANPLSGIPSFLGAHFEGSEVRLKRLRTVREMSRRIRATWEGHFFGASFFMASTIRLLQRMQKASEAAGARFLVLYGGDEAVTEFNVPPNLEFELAAKLASLQSEVVVSPSVIQEELRNAGLSVSLLDVSELTKPGNHLEGDYHLSEQGAAVYAGILASVVGKLLPAK